MTVLKYSILVLVAFALQLLLPSCGSFAYLSKVTEDTFPKAIQCGKCHIDIYQEWKTSTHAFAYKNQYFRKATNNYKFEKCLSCHAPQPYIVETEKNPRAINRDEGITCVSCHFKAGKMLGPFEPTGSVKPHPIEVKPKYYKSSKLCGRCHVEDFAEWEKTGMVDKKTCQQCHMPEVKRKTTQSKGGISNLLVAFEQEVLQRKHVFAIFPPQTEKNIISLKIKRNKSTITLSLKNNLPHSLPAGNFGFRVLMLSAIKIDAQGKETTMKKVELAKELKNAIPAQKNLIWQLPIATDAVFLRIKLIRLSYHKTIDLADIKVPLP